MARCHASRAGDQRRLRIRRRLLHESDGDRPPHHRNGAIGASLLRASIVKPPTLPCAIYTRKSSEEGLDQAFNSLDAQREACSAYILSQKALGWSAVPAAYDDGGFSGGNTDRPALQRLLADIGARRIRIVVVYKVDRLTRSLADFA